MGFFTLGPLGELYGLGLAAIIIALTILLADRLFLVGVGAREIDNRFHEIYFQLQNLSCKKGLRNVRLYSSHIIPENIYCLDPVFNKPCIIFSEKILEDNANEVIHTSLEFSLTFLERGKGKFSNIMAYLTAVLLTPFFGLKRIGLRSLSVVYFFIFLPLIYLKDFICEVTLSEVLEELDAQQGLRVTYFLERFKYGENNFINNLAKDFSIFKKRDPRLWASLQGSYANIFNNYMKWHERKKLQ